MPTHTITYGWESGTNVLSGGYSSTAPVRLAFSGTIPNASDQTFTGSLTAANLESIFMQATQDMTVRVNAVNEVQTITITGSPTGGTFTISLGGFTTAAIAWNATAAAVQSALEALTSIGAGNVVVTGGPLPATLLTVTFRKGLAATNVAQLTSASSLTGGSSPAIVHATTTAGVAAAQTFNLKAIAPLPWDQDLGYFPNPCTANWTHLLVSNDSGAPGNFYCEALSN